MKIVDLATTSPSIHEQAAALLVHDFDEPRGWPTLELARDEVLTVLREGFAFAAIDESYADASLNHQSSVINHPMLLGWIGGLPEYGGRVWELHPMVVRRDRRRRGVGRALVETFEREAAQRGGLTATLGTDDDSAMTSVADVDLYVDVPRHIRDLRDLGRHHPFLFYQRLGYVVTGVMPDANGRGRPDIFMSKRL